MRKSNATKPTRIAAPLARERSRRRGDRAGARRDVADLRSRYLARDHGVRRPESPSEPEVTGLRSFLARLACRQFVTGRRRRTGGRIARSARSAADGSRNLADPALPEVSSLS